MHKNIAQFENVLEAWADNNTESEYKEQIELLN